MSYEDFYRVSVVPVWYSSTNIGQVSSQTGIRKIANYSGMDVGYRTDRD